MAKKYYVLQIEGGIEPTLSQPFPTEDERDQYAKEVHKTDDPECDAVLWLDSSDEDDVTVGSYSGGFFREESAPV